ncbi:MAG TPA: DMT family transporter [Gemmataceae bacterium]|nr:DMT family transporter [Gemmataceae bacterium]
MLGGCFFTAWMGLFAHSLKDACDWRLVALARSSIAFVLACFLARLSGARLVFWRPYTLWLRGCASSVSLLCTFFALAQLPTSEVMTLTNTFPIWVALLSWPLLRVRPQLFVWLAAACGVCGVALIQAPHVNADAKAASAVALSLTAALTSAIAMLGLHRLKELHPWAVVAHYSGVATLFVLASWVIGGPPQLVGIEEKKTLLLLLAVGIAATLGQLCVTRAFTSGSPTRISVVGLMQVVFALGLDLLFEGPNVQLVTLAGIGLVLAPTAWMMVDRSRPANQAVCRSSGRNDAVNQSRDRKGAVSLHFQPLPYGRGSDFTASSK